MRKRTFILLLLLCKSFAVLAQKEIQAENFLNDYVKTETKGKIIYTEKIWPSNLTQIKEALSKEITQNRDYRIPNLDNNLPEQIKFTKKEIKFVLKEIIENNKQGWVKNRIIESQFIARDTIEIYLQKKSPFYNYYSFSKPIFLRNNSICIFYCDGNDGGRLATYMKVNGKWKYYSSFFRWLS